MSRPCPCTSKKPYDRCCGPFHAGTAAPETAEALMRSRFSAYALGKVDYLIATRPETKRVEENRDTLHIETSTFARENGHWVYVDGVVKS